MLRLTTLFVRKLPFDLRTQLGPYDYFNGSLELPPLPKENPLSCISKELDSSIDALFVLLSLTSTKSFKTVIKNNDLIIAKLANLSALGPFSRSTK